MDEQNKSMSEQWAPPTAARERGYANDPGYTASDYEADRRYSDAARGDDEPDRRTAAIRSDIEHTRAEMTETIDAIQERLRPGNVASRAVENVREAARDKVRQVASTVQEAMPGGRASGGDYGNNSRGSLSMTSQWSDTSRHDGGFMNRIVENPVAVALAAGSLAWLAFGGSRSRRQQHHYAPAIYGSTRDGQAFVRETRIDVDTNEMGGDHPSDMLSNASATAAGVAGSARRLASDARSSTQRAMGSTRMRARRMTESNPLVAAGLATAIGLAIGLALPETERENELMGEARDSVVDRAREAARDAAGRVQETAQQVQKVATDAVRAIGNPDAASKDTGSTGAA